MPRKQPNSNASEEVSEVESHEVRIEDSEGPSVVVAKATPLTTETLPHGATVENF